jgi:hypothetical protein
LLSLEELIDARNPQGLPYLPAALSVTDPWGMRFQVISDHSQSEEPTPFSRKRDETWSIVSSGPDRVLETSDDIEYRDELVESNRRKREALREMNEIFSAIGLYTTALQGARHEDLRFPVVNLPSVEELLHRNVLMREDSIADPWGNKYLLEETEVGSDNPKDYYRVRCLGPDGQTGTEDDLTYSNFDWRTHMEESSRRLRARK